MECWAYRAARSLGLVARGGAIGTGLAVVCWFGSAAATAAGSPAERAATTAGQAQQARPKAGSPPRRHPSARPRGLNQPRHVAPEERTQARLVMRHVRIEPKNWKHLEHCRKLGASAIKVSLRGKRQPSEAIALHRRWRPTVHALVIDTSASMFGDLPAAKLAAAEYVKQLRPESESALILTFDDHVALARAQTSSTRALLEAINAIEVGARTSLMDAIHLTVRELDAQPQRSVMILLTDGADTSSFYTPEDIFEITQRRPDLTIFTIGIGLKNDTGDRTTEEFLRKLAADTNGTFFDLTDAMLLPEVFRRIRGTLESESILTVRDPDPAGGLKRLKVSSVSGRCKVHLFEEPQPLKPIERPFPKPPRQYALDLTPAHRSLYRRAAERTVDRSCALSGNFQRLNATERFDPLWFFAADANELNGCGLEVSREPGLLYRPSEFSLTEFEDGLLLRARRMSVEFSLLDELPRGPEELLDGLAKAALAGESRAKASDQASRTTQTDAESRNPEDPVGDQASASDGLMPAPERASPFYQIPNLVNGSTLLEIRPILAHAAFLRESYRDWVLERLRDAAEQELAQLVARYQQQFPKLPAEVVARAARQSQEGRRVMATAKAPSPIHLGPYLAAWLGDITAHDLFRRWERQHIERAITDTESRDLDFSAAWKALHQIFFVPSDARVLTLTSPVHDLESDRIGYWRVVLPRAGWLNPRLVDNDTDRRFSREQMDLIPDHPFALWLVQLALAEEPELQNRLNAGQFRVEHLSYELLGDAATLDPSGAFRQARVVLRLSGASAEPAQLEIRGDIGLSDAERSPRLEAIVVEAFGNETTQLASTLQAAVQRAWDKQKPLKIEDVLGLD